MLNMMNNDPTLWPDLNPLLGGNPAKVLKLFPMSVYGKTADEVRAEGTAEAIVPASPMPFTPSGLVSQGTSIRSTSMSGRSSARGRA